MEKNCWICKRTETPFLKQKEELLKQVNQDILKCDEIEKNIIKEATEELGFTEENKNKIRKLNCSDVTLSAVLENEPYFLNSEPNLQILLDYCKKYNLSNGFKNINELANAFCNEPTEEKYIQKLYDNRHTKEKLLSKKEKLEALKTYFVLYKLEPKFYSNPQYEPPKTITQKYSSIGKTYEIPNRPHPDTSFESLGFKFETDVYLCPICATLFLQAADAVFETREAQIRAAIEEDIENELYDDDDEYDEY